MSLFKKMDPKADVGTPTSLKSSVQRGIRTKLLEQYPDTLGANDGALLEQIMPKKEPMTSVKFKYVVVLTQARTRPDYLDQGRSAVFPAL